MIADFEVGIFIILVRKNLVALVYNVKYTIIKSDKYVKQNWEPNIWIKAMYWTLFYNTRNKIMKNKEYWTA